jgi:predicted dehydrogenase
MCEKPAGVYTKQVREMIAAADKYGKSLGIVFCVRTNSAYRKIKEIIESNKYGELHRFNWIITDWYRTQAYYNLSSWRATWSGEGGGVLINQCPHNLDLWQWMCGMPSKIRAVCKEGLWHDIEVEDDVTIFAEYENGATGVFVASTGDYPGSNRLEITLDRAKIVYENDNLLHIYELSDSLKENCAGAQKAFEKISYTERVIDTDERSTGHVGILEAFANNILYDTPLLADGREGINELSISNAAHLSSWTNSEVTLPLDDELFYKELQKKIAGSKEKKVENKVETDLSGSFH